MMNSDIIIGYRANDSYFSYAGDFVNGTLSLSDLSEAMRLGKLGEQVVLKSKKAFKALTFVEAIKAPRQEYFAKYKLRDEEARAKYRQIVTKPMAESEIYVLDIIILSCEVSRQFAAGNPRYLVGMSGAELADSVVEAAGGTVLKENDGTYTLGPEYWAGWALAYYQWLSHRSFAYMHSKGLGIKEVVAMYYPLHEADLSKFAAAADGIIKRNKA